MEQHTTRTNTEDQAIDLSVLLRRMGRGGARRGAGGLAPGGGWAPPRGGG